jgi:23S rRNA (guanosine2251-2'-O)-methyltransferase
MRQKLYHAITMESNLPQKILILHNIRSNENVGSLFRTADAIGVDQIILTGYSPSPIDRFGRPVGAIAKTALGAEKVIPFEKTEDIKKVIDNLKTRGVRVLAVEQTPRSIDYKDYTPVFPIACILGNEVEGIESEVLELVDSTLEIPMRGTKESLNVAVAGGVVLFRLFDRT